MHIRLLNVARLSAVLLAMGCGDGRPPTASAGPTPTSPSVLSLTIRPDTVTLGLGGTAQFTAVKVMSDGTRIPVSAVWGTLNQDMLVINGRNGSAIAVGPGRTSVHAFAEGFNAVVPAVVSGPTSIGTSDVVTVESFSIIEFHYSSQPDYWYYAPQVRVTARSGRSATVLLLTFSIPGLDDPTQGTPCAAGLPAGVPLELNGVVGGDWVHIISQTNHRASGADASAAITYVDDAGTMATRTVNGPIVRASPPTTDLAGGGACFPWFGTGN